MDERLRMTLGEAGIAEVDDAGLAAELERLDSEELELARQTGLYGVDDDVEIEPPRPFDVEVPRPRAVPLERLCQLLGNEVPADLRAVAGNRAPLLIHQGITAFNPPGRAPASVWGIGYEIRLDGADADTVSIEPSTRLLEVARLDQQVHLSLSLGGELHAPGTGLSIDRKVPGFALQGVDIGASTRQGLQLGLSFKFELLKIESGPVGAGGARWNFYRQDERLAGFQPLLHTIIVPRKSRKLEALVTTWVVRAGGWFGLRKPIRWVSAPHRFTIAVEGL